MCDHGSIGLPLGMGSFGGFFYFIFCWLFPFLFSAGRKVASAQDFGCQSKGEDHFRSWFPFLLFVHLVTILYCSDIVQSEDLFAHFFCFLSILDQELSFLLLLLFFLLFFTFSHSLIGNFLLFFLLSL